MKYRGLQIQYISSYGEPSTHVLSIVLWTSSSCFSPETTVMRFETGTIAAIAAACVPLVSAAPPVEAGQVVKRHGSKPSSYSFSSMTSTRYATPLPTSSPVTTYMPAASMKAIMPSGVKTTTWNKNETSASDWDNPYGQAEWNRRWATFMPNVSISTFSISTTVQATPVPSSSRHAPTSRFQLQ